MNWLEQREQFQRKIDTLAQEDIQGMIMELKNNATKYIEKEDGDAASISALKDKLEDIKTKYSILNNNINKFILKESKTNDISNLLYKNGEIQKQIQKLEKVKDEINIDVESAIARDQLLRSRNSDISRHKLFILDRPVRKGMIPYLWILGVIFIGIGIIIFNSAFENIVMSSGILLTTKQYITNKPIVPTILVAVILIIIATSFEIAAAFKK